MTEYGDIHYPALDVSAFRQWRDYLYYLKVGDTRLAGEPDCGFIGHYGLDFCLDTVLHLAEEAPGIRRKFHGIALADEISDGQVMTAASAGERLEYFTASFLRQAAGRNLTYDWGRAEMYCLAAVAIGSALTGEQYGLTIKKLSSAVARSRMDTGLKTALAKTVSRLAPERIEGLTAYLRFSQTQMIQDEVLSLRRGFAPAGRIGSTPLDIGGQVYDFSGRQGDGRIGLSDDDIDVFLPLLQAVRRGRMDMTEQARETAYQEMNVRRYSLDRIFPPDYWYNGDTGKRLESTTVLLFFPYQGYDLSQSADILRTIAGIPRFRNGWHLLSVDRNSRQITKIERL